MTERNGSTLNPLQKVAPFLFSDLKKHVIQQPPPAINLINGTAAQVFLDKVSKGAEVN